MNFTSTIDTTLETFEFVKQINKKQFEIIDPLGDNETIKVLFNKGRYFEMSVYNKELRNSMAQAIKSKVQYNNMLVGPKSKLEALVKAFNKRGYYVNIDIDWI